MTRILMFTGPRAPKRFELMWAALNISDEKSERTPAIIRKEARLQEMLGKISIDKNGGDPLSNRELEGEPTITLSQEDFDFLFQATEKVKWTPVASRDVVDLWDWLSTAEKRD
jgi:hypothetical protein